MKNNSLFCVLIFCLFLGIQSASANAKQCNNPNKVDCLQTFFDNPIQTSIRLDETIRGTVGAPLLLVKYSDFECPYCTRGSETVKKLLEKYEGKIQFIYKHLPLPIHANAMVASRYYEAIRLQDENKAFQFHDHLYTLSNQKMLTEQGTIYLDTLAKKLGVDMDKLRKDINSSAVTERIEQDIQEAQSIGFRGTPAFTINGVPLVGAHPIENFDIVINMLIQTNKLTL